VTLKNIGLTKISLATVIIIICVVAAAVAVYWLQTEESSELLPIPSILKPANETANWQTYRNDEYGYEIKIPPKWYLKDSPETIMIQNMENVASAQGYLTNSSVFTMSIETDRSSSIEEWVEKISSGYEVNSREKQKKKMLNEIKTIKIGGEENKVWWHIGNTAETIYFLRNGKGYHIMYFSYDVNLFNQDKGIFNQILSTFKFIK